MVLGTVYPSYARWSVGAAGGGAAPPAGGDAEFSLVQSNSNGDVTVTLTGVTAGNLVAVFFSGSFATPPTDITCSDGTSTLTKATTSNGTYQVNQWYYIIAANSGDRTYTISNNEGLAPYTIAYEFDYTGTIVLDKENHGAGNGTAVSSGNVTTTGGTTSQLMLAGASAYGGGNMGSYQIAGENATASIESVVGSNAAWYRIVTANTTGAGTATDSSAGDWAAQIITFKGE